MASPIPAFASQVVLDANTYTVAISTAGGTSTNLSLTRYFYFVSNRTTASNGQSLLYALKTALDTASAGIAGPPVWTVVLSSGYKVQLSHTQAASLTIDVSGTPLLWTNLGFASGNIVVAGSSATTTAANPSLWWWTPNMPISGTGPQPFDPAVNWAIPTSAGTSQFSSDETAAYTVNGTQNAAEFIFNGVQYAYAIRPNATYPNADLQTWWSNGPRNGRRCLMWRDRDNAVGSNAPGAGSSTPYNYIEYQPSDELRKAYDAKPVQPELLTYWDVHLRFRGTSNGESVLSV